LTHCSINKHISFTSATELFVLSSVQCNAQQHWTEFKIIWHVRCPVPFSKIVTWFMDQSSPNLEHSFYVRCTKRFCETDPCVSVF